MMRLPRLWPRPPPLSLLQNKRFNLEPLDQLGEGRWHRRSPVPNFFSAGRRGHPPSFLRAVKPLRFFIGRRESYTSSVDAAQENLPPSKRAKPKYPWVLLLLLIASVYVFWVLPIQLGTRPVRVEFAGENEK